jgi:hypothetical protein
MGRSGATWYFRAERIVDPQNGHPHLRFGQRVLSSATPSVLGDFTHHSTNEMK